MKNNNFYVYAIYFPTSNKYYIGQTKRLEKRMFKHIDSLFLVEKALRKYKDWKVSILHTCKNRDEANRIEIEEIRNFNSVAPNGYNLTHGGEGGDTLTNNPNREIIREKNRQNRKGNQNAKGLIISKEKREADRQRMLGNKLGAHPLSEEHKIKISKSLTGRKRPKHSSFMKHNNPMRNPNVRIKRLKALKIKLAKLEDELL